MGIRIIEQKSKWHNEQAKNNIGFKYSTSTAHTNACICYSNIIIIIIIFQLRMRSNANWWTFTFNKISKGWIEFRLPAEYGMLINQITKFNSIAIFDMNECVGNTIGPSQEQTMWNLVAIFFFFFSCLFVRRTWLQLKDIEYLWFKNSTSHNIWSRSWTKKNSIE